MAIELSAPRVLMTIDMTRKHNRSQVDSLSSESKGNITKAKIVNVSMRTLNDRTECMCECELWHEW